jgi:hypothetical protein
MIRALKERYGDRHLAIERCRQLKKQTQGDDGSWKKLAAACRGMTHWAIPALCEEHGCQGPSRDSVAREPLKDALSRGDNRCARNAAVE